MRYHVSLGMRRTTISLDNTLAVLLSLKLGEQPRTPAAHAAVRQWLQARLDEHGDPQRIHVSQWLQTHVVEALLSLELRTKYDHWILSSPDK